MASTNKLDLWEKESLRLFEFYANELPYHQTYKLVAGVDEVGRGPLAGPVYAACVILPFGIRLEGLADSKKIPEARRAVIAESIKEKAYCYSFGYASVEEIEKLNILNATMLAMKRAVEQCPFSPDLILVDGNKCPEWPYNSEAIIKGDSLMPSIAAASILAKEKRDSIMKIIATYDNRYSFELHKGYGTKAHYEALEKHGVSIFHRNSFLKRLKP